MAPNVTKNSRAFTLLELLVVIAIIGILAVLLLAALNRSRSAAYSAVCKSNLHQMGVGLRLYTSDYRAYPFYIHDDSYAYWHAYLEPYVGATWNPQTSMGRTDAKGQLWLCPAYAHLSNLFDPAVPQPAWFDGAYAYNWRGVTDESNWFLGLGGINDEHGVNSSPIRDSAVLQPSAMMAITDAPLAPAADERIYGEDDFSDYQGFYDYDVESGQLASPVSRGFGVKGQRNLLIGLRDRHNYRWNVLFCDGHVQTHRTKELFDWRDDNVLRLRNNDNLPHREMQPDPP